MNRSATLGTILLGVVLLACRPAIAATVDPRISVTYHAPLISIEASGATVAEVLREVGRKVGFSIVEAGSSDARLSFSIQNASLPAALQQLLRSENHVLQYRKDTQTIDTVMLLGAHVARGPTPFNHPEHAVSRISPPAENSPTPAASASGGPPSTQADLATYGRLAEGSPEVADATDLLLRYAWSGVPASQPTSARGVGPAASSSALPTQANAADPGSTLAIPTRLAQQNLTKLVEALSAATSSMRSSQQR
jgi:hypothetical protein